MQVWGKVQYLNVYFSVIQNVRKEYKTYIFLEMFRLVTL